MKGLLHHVEMYVGDLEVTKAFWTWLLVEELGYEIFQEWPQGISYKLGQTYLVFVQTEDQYLDPVYHRKHSGLNHLAFHGESPEMIDQLRAKLEQKGVVLLYPERYPYAGGQGHYAVFFEDPNRMKVEVVVRLE